MRVMLVIGSLRFGGAERVVSNLANHWAQQGHAVSIVTLHDAQHDAYPLDERIVRISHPLFGETRSRYETAWRAVKRIWRIVQSGREQKPDVIISFMTDMNLRCLGANFILRKKLIISERTNPDKQKITKLDAWLRRKLYRFADRVVFVSKGVADRFPELPAARKRVIYNPLNLAAMDSAERDIALPERSKMLLTVGRLAPAKGYEWLIAAFAQVAQAHKGWNLVIVGEGALRAPLEAQIEQSGLAGRVFLPGASSNPFAVMKKADLYVLSSRHEGFPNALIEAMACGAPAVSFNCDFGPAEIIRDGENGLLVPAGDVDALAQALDRAMGDDALRERLAAGGMQIRDELSVDAVAAQWDGLIAEMLPQ